MKDLKMPDYLEFGFGKLYELSYLEVTLGITRNAAMRYLNALRIKPFYFGDKIYFNLMSLKRILFVLSKPDGEGFVAPGSKQKNKPGIKKKPGYLFEVTDEIIAQASKPEILSEMAACSGRSPDLLKKFVTNPVGRPPQRKEKER